MSQAEKCRYGQHSKDEGGTLHTGSCILVQDTSHEEELGQLGTCLDGGESYLPLVKAAHTCRALHKTRDIYPSL